MTEDATKPATSEPVAGPVQRPVRPSPYRHFDGMCWPVPGERLDELERALRFSPDGAALSMSDRMVIASFLSAYRQLVVLPVRVRDARVRELRKGPGMDDGTVREAGPYAHLVRPNVGGEARLAALQPPQTTTATPQGVASTDQLER